MRKPSLRRQTGVTLLEFIVVVAVVAALAALLIPATLSSRGKMNAVRCTSNLRAIGAALHAYIAENNGYYPYNRNGNPAPNNKFMHQTLRDAGIDTYVGRGETYKDAGIWYCPADEGRPEVHAAKSYGISFYLGARRDATDTPAWQRKPAASDRSGGLIYMMDHDSGHTPKSTGGNLQSSSWPFRHPTAPGQPPASGVQVEFRHGGVSNALFVDGHVEALKYDDIAGTNERYLTIR